LIAGAAPGTVHGVPPAYALALLPTEPGGPQRGEVLRVEGDRIVVARRTALRRGVVATCARSAVREVATGSPESLQAVPWLSPGAQIAAQGMASGAAGAAPREALMALAVPGPVTEQTWLFRGAPAEVAAAAAAVTGAAAPAAGGGTAPGRRGRRGLAGGVVSLGVAGALIALAVTQADRAIDHARDLRSVLTSGVPPALAPAPPLTPRPHTVAALARLWAGADGLAPGLARDAAAPPTAGREVWRAGLRFRGRPVRLLLHAGPGAARRARRPGDVLRGNLLVRGPALPAPVRAAMWRALGPAPAGRR